MKPGAVPDDTRASYRDYLGRDAEHLTRLGSRVTMQTLGGTAMAGKVQRNDPCPCGSGKKYKKCHELKEASQRNRGNTVLMIVVGLLVAAGVAAGITSLTNDRAHTARPSGVWSAEHGHYH